MITRLEPINGWGWRTGLGLRDIMKAPKPVNFNVLNQKKIGSQGKWIYGEIIETNHVLSGFSILLRKRGEEQEMVFYNFSAHRNAALVRQAFERKSHGEFEILGYVQLQKESREPE